MNVPAKPSKKLIDLDEGKDLPLIFDVFPKYGERIETLFREHGETPTVLYHYTTAAGLLGILRSAPGKVPPQQ